MKEGGLGTVGGFVVGGAGSGLGAGSLGDAPDVGLMGESWRGRFGSGVAVVGSVCRLRPGIMDLANSERDLRYTNLLVETQKA